MVMGKYGERAKCVVEQLRSIIKYTHTHSAVLPSIATEKPSFETSHTNRLWLIVFRNWVSHNGRH